MEIDEEKLKRMILRVYLLERKNAESISPKSFSTMVEDIKKIIEEEVKKCC